MSKEIKKISEELLPEAIKIVMARLETVSPNVYFSSGDEGVSYSRDEMMKRVENGDEIGKKFVLDQLEFLRAIKDGSLLQTLTSSA